MPPYDATTVRLKSSLTTWRRSVLQRFTAVDVVTLLYVAVATAAVLAFSGQDHASWDLLLTAHALLVTLVLVAPLARQSGPLGRFLGDWYPMLLLGALYAEVGVLNVDLGYQHDQVIQRLELWVFGSQLSYRWIREMPNPLLSWVLHGCYLAYYAILYTSPLGLWFSGRRDAARRTIFAVMVTFYLCYVVFLFFPVAGPRYTFELAHNAATSVVARRSRGGRRTVRPALLAASRPVAHAADGWTGAVGGVRPIPLCRGRRGWTNRGVRGARFAVHLRVAARHGPGHDARTRARDRPRLGGHATGRARRDRIQVSS